jgi:Glycosyl hydrolase family 76
MSTHLPGDHRGRGRRRRIRLGRIVAWSAALVALIVAIAVFALNQSRSPARPEVPRSIAGQAGDQALHAARTDRYLTLATKGIAAARGFYWNPEHAWFNDRLNDTDQYPLGTIWTLFPLWEALSGVAIAEPSPAHRDTVRSFADFAETYFNHAMGGYGPYPGSHTRGDEIWFDDNAWWGLAFVDAYRATRERRYLDDAALALRFIDTRGWDASRQRVRWSTRSASKGSNWETLGGAAALAAELYEYTGRSPFLASARRYIGAADAFATPSPKNGWLYGTPDEPPLTYTEGTMIGAQLAMCHVGANRACAAAWSLGIHALKHWKPRSDPYYKPPADTIMFRYVLQLAADKRAARKATAQNVQIAPNALYDWARQAAEDAVRNARAGELYVKFWDGTAAAKHRDGYRAYRYGQLMTHAAPVALFAWLAAVPRLESGG